jgi:LacI family transcriptional regulator
MKVTFWAIEDLLPTPERLLAALVERQLDGVLLVGTVEPEIIRLIQRSKIPLVLIDNSMPGLSVDAVLNDGFGGAQEAVAYLISKGHRRIAFLSGPTRQGNRPVNVFYTIERRAAGYRTALLEAGIPVDYDLFEAADSVTVEGGYQACKRLVERGVQFSALFCANDFVAIGAMKALREAGLRVPEDVSLLGFDNVDMAEYLFPPLTTVHTDPEATGYVATRNLLLRFADPEAYTITILLECRLIKRASVIPYPSH